MLVGIWSTKMATEGTNTTVASGQLKEHLKK